MNKLNKVPTVAKALSERARVLLEASSEGESKRKGAIQVPQGLVDSLSYHLGRGETHYPDRPGMSELRNMVGREVGKYLDDSRDGNQVLITASEGEAVFVTMLGLDLVPVLLNKHHGRKTDAPTPNNNVLYQRKHQNDWDSG